MPSPAKLLAPGAFLVLIPGALLLLDSGAPPPSHEPPPLPAGFADAELAGFEDYRTATGTLEGDVLHASLEVRPVRWRPWGEDGPTLPGHTFVPEGEAAKVPGPLLRVTAGTPIHLSLRNLLQDTILVRGLRDRGQELPPGTGPGPLLVTLPFVGDSLVVGPGERAQVHFTPTVPGSYFWFGKAVSPGWSDTPQPLFGASGADRSLVGVLVVDPPDEAPDPEERIILITHWADQDDPDTFLPSARFLLNGRAWPHTERMEYQVGDTIRWRVINQSGAFHPMHLHGFYFRVDEWTAQTGGPAGPLAPGTMAVTWPLPVTAAMRMTWVAEEPGNWLFHCHLMRHMSWVQAPPSPGFSAHHAPDDWKGTDLLGGMVMGITVHPREGWSPAPEPPRRTLRLHIGKRPGVFGEEPGYGFVLQEGRQPPAPDSVHFPGSPILLTRGEPTEIVVFNHADVALGVHWHGLELESRFDGVPGWSGMPGEVVPAISPGDSLRVHMTPPRAGSFMYHVHSEPGHQLALGLYGPFLVLEPGETWDRERDVVLLMGALGAGEDPPPALNGLRDPGPLEFVAGTQVRLRLLQISPDENRSVRLLRDGEPVVWSMVARDGWDLSPEQIEARPAVLPFVDVGTTADFLWTPRTPGEHVLEVVTDFDPGLAAFPRKAPPPDTLRVPIRVQAAGDRGN